ncbi:MAG: glycine zipper domain-containing protein [Gammaproteobacteria bacterium]|nr:glycine zipper domain-containing protein [Gammaproteobacteria bacterium]
MRSLTITSTLILLHLLTACTQLPIIVDKRGIDPIAYAQDLKECKEYADEIEVVRQTATTAAESAAVGGALGLIFGDSTSASRGAAGGGVLGAYRGYKESNHDRERVVRNCLIGRGYRVL